MIPVSTLSVKHHTKAVFDDRKTFRLIYDAVTNPAKAVNIADSVDMLIGDDPMILAVAMTLLDGEVSFNVCEKHSLSAEITSLTHARNVSADSADYIFIYDLNAIIPVMESIKLTTLSKPLKSSTVVIRNDGEPVCPLKFSGPGIDGTKTVTVSQNVKRAIILRDSLNFVYPQGVDMIFISSLGDLFAIPRFIRVHV